jgi:hypothetical protein
MLSEHEIGKSIYKGTYKWNKIIWRSRDLEVKADGS